MNFSFKEVLSMCSFVKSHLLERFNQSYDSKEPGEGVFIQAIASHHGTAAMFNRYRYQSTASEPSVLITYKYTNGSKVLIEVIKDDRKKKNQRLTRSSLFLFYHSKLAYVSGYVNTTDCKDFPEEEKPLRATEISIHPFPDPTHSPSQRTQGHKAGWFSDTDQPTERVSRLWSRKPDDPEEILKACGGIKTTQATTSLDTEDLYYC